MEGATTAQPHVLLVSFPAQGHLNPLLRFAKRLASKGLLVTFSSTTYIGHRISVSTESPHTSDDTPIPIGKGHLRFEFFPDGWEHDDPRRFDLQNTTYLPLLRAASYRALNDMVGRHAEDGRPVSCIIHNPFLPWILDLAEELNIPSAVLWVQSCAVFSTYYHYFHSLAEFPSVDNPDMSVDIPGLPALKPDELPTFLLPSNPYKSVGEAVFAQFKNIHKATWVFANTFEELERESIEAISGISPVIPVGPLVDEAESEIRGDLWKAADCMDWLDLQNPNSVVYVSVGSVVVLAQEEMVEMANGLRNCGRPFLWVVREMYQDLLPQGFVEEVRDRGMVVSWSPQERVLSHGSIACFVMHCGWNSTLEVLTAGVPVVACPQWGDQVTGAKFIADVYGIGVKLGVPIKREELEKCVGEVMEGEKAEKMREKVLEWKEKARKAVADGGSSDRNVQAFVDEIVRRTAGGGGGGEVCDLVGN